MENRTEVYRNRAVALALVVYAAPLFTVERVADMVRGPIGWALLSRHMDWVDDRLSAAEDACAKGGDRKFVSWVAKATDWFTNVVDALLDRLARRPVR